LNFHRFIRPLVSCAALAAVSLALAGGCGSGAGSAGLLGDGGGGGSDLDSSTSPDASPPAPEASFDANACQPGDISDFKPVWKPPTPFHQGACLDPDTGSPLWPSFRTACLGASGSKTECAQFTDPTNVKYYKCGQCIATADSADHYGPVIVHTGWAELNIPGCLANAMNDPTGVKCGASVQAARSCAMAACGANCPVTSEATLTLFNMCTRSANDTLCTSYVGAAACLDQIPDAGDVAKCTESKPFDARFDDMVELFCGGLIDAGSAAD
jgi:hypothetical protein